MVRTIQCYIDKSCLIRRLTHICEWLNLQWIGMLIIIRSIIMTHYNYCTQYRCFLEYSFKSDQQEIKVSNLFVGFLHCTTARPESSLVRLIYVVAWLGWKFHTSNIVNLLTQQTVILFYGEKPAIGFLIWSLGLPVEPDVGECFNIGLSLIPWSISTLWAPLFWG